MEKIYKGDKMEVVLKEKNMCFIKTNKFKTLTLKVVFYNEYSKENATYLSLLTRVLSNTSKKYNTKKKLNNKLYDLYDANIYLSTNPSYKLSMTSFTLNMVNPIYVDDKNMLKESVKFLNEIINNPNVIDDAFDEKVFEEEKNKLSESIKKIYNNKARYAIKKAISLMCENEMLSIGSLGSLEQLDKITPKSLYEFYKQIISTSRVSIYCLGDITEEIIENVKKFNKFNNNEGFVLNAVMEDKIIPVDYKRFDETQDINQCHLVMGYRIPYNNKEKEYALLQIFNMMYGGLFNSNLFMNVREKYSLAYDVSSSLIGDSKVMIVTAGIDKENIDKTIEIINYELDQYKKGIIDEELLETAKTNAISYADEIEDSPSSYISYLMQNEIFGVETTIECLKENINKVTIKDIENVSKRIYLDTIYVLKGE